MRKTVIGAAVLLMLGAASGADAQVWDSPSFMGPRPGSDIGLYLVDGEASDFGIHGVWRTSEAMNLGIRVGYLDTPGDGVLLLGAETWGTLAVEDADFPLDLSWTVGAGALVNGGTAVTVPIGISLGHTFDGESISLQVFGHPRLGLVIFENNAGNLELDLEGQFDLGTDIYLNPDLTLRVGVSLGYYDALGIGLALRQ